MKSPFLSALGVMPIDQQRNPVVSVFPYAFNPCCQHIWDAVITTMKMTENVDANWGKAITLFIEVCVAKDLFPFSNLKQSANDIIVENLNTARKAIVKFMDQSNMLQMVWVQATRREVNMTSTGFVLRVYGRVKLRDPTFEQWLLKMPLPRFELKHEGKYIKHLSHNIAMVVYNEGASLSQRWHIGYEIVVHQFPSLPGEHLPSQAEMEKFVLDLLYMPVLKSHRPRGFNHRLL